VYALSVKPILSRCSDLIVAIAAINRSVAARLKRHFGVLAAGGAFHGEHLTLTTGSTIAVGFPCLTARGTALRLVGIAFSLEELLFVSAKGEVCTAIGAGELFVLKTHR